MLRIGQGLYGKVSFADGAFPDYDRTYLVVSVEDNKIGVLNISSVAGKEHKILFPTNRFINKHFPPFIKKSFAKMDSLVHITDNQVLNLRVLANGSALDEIELSNIIKELQELQKN